MNDTQYISDNMTLTEDEEWYIHIITKFLVPIMFGIIILIGSIGNILVIYVVSWKKDED